MRSSASPPCISYASVDPGANAFLFGASGSNHLTATPTQADLSSGSVVNEVHGFQYVQATSSSGQDSATFVDTVGNDAFFATPAYSYLVNGATGALQQAIGFAFVLALAPPGGHDGASLTDPTTTGGLSFLATPSYSLLSTAARSSWRWSVSRR